MAITEHAQRTYDQMKANLVEHLRTLFPVDGREHRLEISGIEVKDGLNPEDYGSQKTARMNGRTWAVPVFAQFTLKDQSGRVVDRARMKIIDLPRLTNRGSYIVGGSEYMFPTQKRLRSGPYIRSGQNDELRTFFNMAKGRNFYIGIQPSKGYFQLQVDTTRDIRLYVILKALGVTDDQMVRAWGREAFVNNRVTDPATVTKSLKAAYEKMSYGAEAPADLEAGLREVFDGSRMDPGNVELTLGRRWDRATGGAILAASAKMLRVGRGEEKEDNRDSLIHNDIVDLSDFVVERFRDYQFRSRIQRTIRFNIDRRDKIAQIISRDAFQRPVSSLFTESQLSQSPMQTNPLGMVSDYTAITVRGEGGIQQDNALTRSVRALDPSHMGFLDPAHTPEGQAVGTTLHLASATRKKGRELVTRVFDVRTGREVERTPTQLWKATVAFPESVDEKTGKIKRTLGQVKVTREGVVQKVPAKDVEYAFVMPETMVDVNTASIPFVSHNNGARVMLASKLSSQAKPLAEGESPLVQVGVAGSKETVEKGVGTAFAPKSPVAGTVEKITNDYITVDGEKVPIPHYFPLNNNNYVHARPTVKVGQRVRKGQILADTNYVKDGQLAMGKNLRVAYTPYKGMNVEDGVVVSRSAAAKMTSEHLYQQPYSFDPETVIDLKRYRAYFPNKVTEEQAKKLDERGVVKKGQTLEPGDIIVASMRKRPMGTESQRMASISKILAREFSDDSMTWDKDVTGVVQDVAWRSNEIIVHVRTAEPMRVGDKVVGRHGNKGIVVHVLEDDEMPRDEKERPIDIIMNPNGVVSRMNLGQILETTAGKISEKTGKPFVARGFGDNSADRIAKELKSHGLKDHETIYDPVDNQKIPGILVGPQYIYKLEHQVTKKTSARGGGVDEDYTSEQQPVRGKTGGRAIGSMELYALLAHGALSNVHEMYTHKSNFDPEVWRAIESGAPLPPPRPAYAQERFTAMLKGMGIHTQHNQDSVSLVPFLDKQVKELSNGEITDHKLLRGKDLKEEKNGLFDTKKTGGVSGDKWTHIKLPEPLPSPTFEKAILSLLHMKKDEFDDIMAGKKKVKGQTGGKAIKSLLDDIDVVKRLAAARREIVGKSGGELNSLHKEIRFLRVLRDRKIKPGEYVIDRLPVLPPKFRPVYTLPDGSLNVSDVNSHYQATMQLSQQMKSMKGKEFEDQRKKLVPVLYKSVGGIMGLNDGVVERSKPPAGLAKTIAGRGSPKGGYMHSRLLKRRQDVSATNVIVANPKLGMDEIGLPEATAWKTFRPFVIRELRTMGMTPLQARKATDDKTQQARKALEKVVSERHVIINRAPTLHKFSVMAFKPKLVSGHAMEIPPLIVGGFNADFDGDTMGVHVPLTAEANAEAAKMLPSKHLYKPGTKKLQPMIEHEYVLGLFKISRPGPVSARRYTSSGEVVSALRARKIAPDASISITGIGSTTPGRVLINDALPPKLRDYQQIWTEKAIQKKLIEVDKVVGRQAFVKTLQAWADIGRRYAFSTGSSFLLSDLQTMTKQRNAAYRRADQIANRVRMGGGSDEEKRKKIVKLYMDVSGGLLKRVKLKANASGQTNNVLDMMEAGARGDPSQVRQMVSNVGVLLDHENKPMTEPVKGTYTEGLDSAEFFQHMYANRKGMIDRSQSVRDPGHLTKQVIVSAASHRVSAVDCGTTNGIMAPTSGTEAHDRYLAEPVAGVGGRGTIVTSEVL
jgi:DNA-directed RNA polymerase beta subunit